MTLNIAKVQVKPGYKLHLKFNNGEERFFNLRPYLNKGIFKELQDERYLKKVRPIIGGIQWPHEQDFSVNTLYYRGLRFRKPKGMTRRQKNRSS